jgi:hypothetical protein
VFFDSPRLGFVRTLVYLAGFGCRQRIFVTHHQNGTYGIEVKVHEPLMCTIRYQTSGLFAEIAPASDVTGPSRHLLVGPGRFPPVGWVEE